MKLHNHQAVRSDGWSSPVIEDIFTMHFPKPSETEKRLMVHDLTFGLGKFWDWKYEEAGIDLTATAFTEQNYEDAEEWFQARFGMSIPYVHREDFTNHGFVDQCEDVVIFDPPHTSSGTASDGGTQAEDFGSDRNKGGPQNMKEVQRMFSMGLTTALRLARVGVIVKIQGMVESRKYWPTHALIYEAVVQEYDARSGDWYIADEVYVRGNRRPQPKGRKIEHFHSKPAIYTILKRKV